MIPSTATGSSGVSRASSCGRKAPLSFSRSTPWTGSPWMGSVRSWAKLKSVGESCRAIVRRLLAACFLAFSLISPQKQSTREAWLSRATRGRGSETTVPKSSTPGMSFDVAVTAIGGLGRVRSGCSNLFDPSWQCSDVGADLRLTRRKLRRGVVRTSFLFFSFFRLFG